MEFPVYEFKEKVADAMVHAVALLAAVIGVTVLLIMIAQTGDGGAMAAGAIFGAGLLACFSMSACYHIVEPARWKAVLRRADHAAIYLMIAGAYTPIAAIVIGGSVGWALLSFVWLMALIGIGLNIALPQIFERAPVALYLMIGWALLGAGDSLIQSMSVVGLWLIVASGTVFTLGVLVFQWARLPFHNAIWHGFVLVGSAFLYAAIFVELTGAAPHH